MPPKKSAATAANGKRKASASPGPSESNGSKKVKSTSATAGTSSSSDNPIRAPHPDSKTSEENGIVLRKFYPPEMSNARCHAYSNDEIPRPIELLKSALADTASARADIAVGGAVVHWFKCDLRMRDNRALHLASRKAKEKGVPLIALYVVSPQDFEAHLTSAVRVDFFLRSLAVLRGELAKLDIPLYAETVERRRQIPGRIVELLGEWGANHLFANVEYEVDELRREAKLVRACLEKGIAMDVVSDTCVVEPGELFSGSGKPYAVYSPWFRAWVAHIHGNPELIDLFDAPEKNPASARTDFKQLFDTEIPETPDNKKLTAEELKRFKSLWPAGEDEAHARLDKFAKEKIGEYHNNRNLPAANGTSCLSVHFATGSLSTRTAVNTAVGGKMKNLGDGKRGGIQTWISELAWRDFYKAVLANWPYVCMNKPFKPEYSNIRWEYSEEHFQAWCTGQTGFPIVDAAMRQLNHTGYMHNRCRMIVASFLAKDLLLDWRKGEQYFLMRLVDHDFASNNGGWGFSASTGVDPQPYFRIFNPLLQSEKFDSDGEYIRRWVEELREVEGKAVHDPYGRGAGKQAEEKGYPRPIIEHKASRDRCLARYKEALDAA